MIDDSIYYRLYKESEIPDDLIGRGVLTQYGDEVLFCPFGPPTQKLDWKCKICNYKTLKIFIKREHKSYCPICKNWIGILKEND